jgi:hypothetical protein
MTTLAYGEHLRNLTHPAVLSAPLRASDRRHISVNAVHMWLLSFPPPSPFLKGERCMLVI